MPFGVNNRIEFKKLIYAKTAVFPQKHFAYTVAG